jgi:hypothetical protein
LLVWKLENETTERHQNTYQKSFLQSDSSCSDEGDSLNPNTLNTPACSNKKIKSLFKSINPKQTSSGFFEDSQILKGFEKSFYQPLLTEISRANGQIAEGALLSFVKIIYEINTQTKIKK